MTVLRWLRRHWREAVLGVVFLSPWLSLLVLGLLWLREHAALLPWAAATAMLGLAAWPLRRSLHRRARDRARDEAQRLRQPPPDWSAQSRLAWMKVETLAREAEPLAFTAIQPLRDLAVQTVRVVAAHFHPDAEHPEANITIPEALLLTERVARDLRAAALAHVPGVRSVRISRVLAVTSAADKHGPVAVALYQVVIVLRHVWRVSVNPSAGIAALARDVVVAPTSDLLLARVRSYLTRTYVAEIGHAAIDLYSGKLRLSEAELAAASAADTAEARRPNAGPPRLLVAGQVNAGKSSLVNALAGAVVCDVRTTPTPERAVEHILAVDGVPCAVVVDTPGLTTADGSRAALLATAEGCDMIVWVVSAVQPARAVDAAALNALSATHRADPDRRPPPILVAVSHVDQLSPAGEWAPPYNTVEPERAKERAMRRAMESIAGTLGVPLDAVVPVAVPSGGEPWNTEFLWGCIAARLDDAKYRQLERLRTARAGFSWRESAGQAVNLLRILGRAVRRG